MADSSDEKTEDATPKRLREARKKGQVPKSKDLTTVLEMVVVFVIFAVSVSSMSHSLQDFMKLAFNKLSQNEIDVAVFTELGKSALLTLAKVTGPTLAAVFVGAIVFGFAQVGALFTLEPLMPQIEKLNPIEGFKNLFKATTFIELIKNIIKIFLIFLISYQVVHNYLPAILSTMQISMLYSTSVAGEIISKIIIRLLILFTAIALVDYMVQRWQFMKQMRMSKDEVKREYKQDEGDPHVKSHRKALHREFVFGDVGQQVKSADAVVTNPTHVAIAIKYDKQEMGAPQVVAKGQRLFAENIKKIAKENNVPIIRNVGLAWSLLEVEMGDEVPEELYTAVAEILAIVYKMKQAQTGA